MISTKAPAQPGTLLGGRLPSPAAEQGIGPHPSGTAIVARVPLKRPLAVHGGDARTLFLREPKLRDFIDCGAVVRREVFDGDNGAARVELAEDYAALMRWLVRLSGHDSVVLGELGHEDGRAALTAVFRIVQALDLGNSDAAPASSSSAAA